MSVPKLRFERTEEWELNKLGNICQIKTGPFGSALHSSDYVEHGTPIVTTEHFKGGFLPLSKEGLPQVNEKDLKRLSSYELDIGDIVFSRVGSVDINAIVTATQKGWLFSGRVLRVRPEKDINSLYLHYELSTTRVKNNISDRAVGQTMPSINTEILKDTPVYIPERCEQEKIADFFSTLDRVIDKTQAEVDVWEKQKQGIMRKLFNQEIRFKADDGSEYPEWENTTLGNKTIIQRGGSPRPIDSYITTDENGLNWIRIGDVSPDTNVITHTEEKIKPEGLSKTRQVFIGDLILSNSMSFGRPYIVKIDGCIHDGWLLIRDERKNFDPMYLCYLLSSESVQQQYERLCAGSAVKNLNSDIVRAVKIQVPSLLEQQKIANCLSAFDAVIDKAKQELEVYKLLKKGLMQQMFI